MGTILRFLAGLRAVALVNTLIFGLEGDCRRLIPAAGLQSRAVPSTRYGFIRPWPCKSKLGSRWRVSADPYLCAEQARTATVEVESHDGVPAVAEVEQQADVDARSARDDSISRVADSLELLEHYTTEAHPGHQPGRFLGPGPEYNGMSHDGTRWHFLPEKATGADDTGSDRPTGTALRSMGEADRQLAEKFEARGGTALCLSSAFSRPEKLRDAAKKVLNTGEDASEEEKESLPDLANMARDDLEAAGLGGAVELLQGAPATEQALFVLKAADMIEEREAVMRNVWSDIEFDVGEDQNADLLTRLEFQFGSQLARSLDARLQSMDEEDDEERSDGGDDEEKQGDRSRESKQDSTTAQEKSRESGLFNLVLQSGSQSDQRVSEKDFAETLLEPKNLGVALDLVGAYLKNYEIDKANQVISRVMPMCRKRGGTWLVKGLDKLCLVRMKQHLPQEALACLQEIEQIVPFTPDQGWEFYDILYRNLACAYSGLENAEKSLEYSKRCVQVKREHGQPASWFDIWDLGKCHARLGQKTNQRGEMRVAFELIGKAGQMIRIAEPSSKKMLAKILSNAGEVAMGMGDTYHLEGNQTEAQRWYEKAEPVLNESYTLFSTSLGHNKPLTGWAANNVAHCKSRLLKWPEARDFLTVALKIECSRDATTIGGLVEFIDRLMNAHYQLGTPGEMANYSDDLEFALKDLKLRGLDHKEGDGFALLLQRVATAFLVSDEGSGATVPRALELLEESEQYIVAFQSTEHRPGEVEDAPWKVPLDLLLPQVRTSIQILQIAQMEGDLSLFSGAAQFGSGPSPEDELGWTDDDPISDQRADMIPDPPDPEELAVDTPDRSDQPEEVDTTTPTASNVDESNDPLAPDEEALTRKYCLAGSWDGWNDWTVFSPHKDNSSVLMAQVMVPAGQDIEFQIVCDYRWDQRLYPAGEGPGTPIIGPSSEGHGRNWIIPAPETPALLHLRFHPVGRRQLQFYLDTGI